MGLKKYSSLVLACVLMVSCLIPAKADTVYSDKVIYLEDLSGENLDTEFAVCLPSTRVTGSTDATIPANSGTTVGTSVTLEKDDIVSFNCSYTPKSANVKFGVIAPDGLFYGVSGTNGSINSGIRINLRGNYTLAIWNNSGNTVSVTGYVNY